MSKTKKVSPSVAVNEEMKAVTEEKICCFCDEPGTKKKPLSIIRGNAAAHSACEKEFESMTESERKGAGWS